MKANTLSAAAWGQAENKVLRGGGWNNNWNNVRVANRNNNNPDNRNNNIGFRCAGVAPGEFLKGQVCRVYGRGSSAEREKSRSVPGWAFCSYRSSTKDKPVPPCVVGTELALSLSKGLPRDPTLRAGPL